MSMNKRVVWTLTAVVGLALAAFASPALAQTPTGPHGEKLVPLEIKLPLPLFQGTPKHIKAATTLEKYSAKPRPAIYVPEGAGINLALNKKVTSSDPSPIIGELSMVTDGDKEGADGGYVELGPGKQWVQIDLDAAANIYALVVWHYHAEGRVYHSVVVQVSDDPDFKKAVTVFNNDFDNALGLGRGKQLEYVDDNRGRLIDARDAKGEPAKGRYVRLYSNGNTSNDLNHYVEVEVFGKK